MSVDAERLRLELEKMKQLIAADPKILAQFDTNGNGVIDGDEWDAVRDLVIQRIEREEMEAELARFYADFEEDEAPTAEMSTEAFTPAAKPEPRDFEGLELAFDPREERRQRAEAAGWQPNAQPSQYDVSKQVFERDVARRYGEFAAHGVGRDASAGGIGDHRELVVERAGGVKRLFGTMFKREFVIRDGRGDSIGHIRQRENEMLQNMVDYDLFRDPDVNFSVEDDLAGKTYRFTRTTGLGENTIQLANANGRYFAFTTWTMSFLRRKYEVRVEREGVSYYVRRRLLKPWTFDILDPFEEPIGFMEAQWMGLGFLVGASRTYVSVEKDVSNDAMWGFLATALLAEIDSEQGSRKAGFDFFNN